MAAPAAPLPRAAGGSVAGGVPGEVECALLMDTLEYLSTFVSLILGLGVANVLAHFSRLVKRRAQVRWYWVHTLWGVLLLVAMATEWWVLLQWRGVERIHFFVYLSFLIKPAVLFFASDLLFPETGESVVLDLRAHYYDVHRPVFLVAALYPLADLLDTLLKGMEHFQSLGPIYPLAMMVGVGGNVIAAVTANRRYHELYVFVGYVGMIGSTTNALLAV